MAKKRKGAGIKALVLKALSAGFLDSMKEGIASSLETLQTKIYETQRMLIKELALFFFMLVGLVFLLVGLTLQIPKWFHIDIGMSFLFMGLLILVVVLFLRSQWQQRRG
ncbi:hypothetical protein HYS48_02575 [Candidatus Woesearchaeota archaeon]|nr:hypothetical protein [Candidatus Woesearchaeota archaeon]